MKVTVSKDSSGRTIYCVGKKFFYTRAKAEAHARSGAAPAAKRRKGGKKSGMTLKRPVLTAAKQAEYDAWCAEQMADFLPTSTASDAYHWRHAGRRNPRGPKRNPRTGRFVRNH